MRSERMLVLFEPGRGGAATIDLARELAETRRLTLTVVGVAPQSASGSRCGNSALEFNTIVTESVAKDLEHARERLGPIGGAASYEVLVEGTEPSLEQFAEGGGFDIVLLPARRGLFRHGRHPAADRLRRVTAVEVRVVTDRSGQARGSPARSPLRSRTG
jgi:hypothetical protein